MPGPLLMYVVPLDKIDDNWAFLIYARHWYLLHQEAPSEAEAMWSMWEVTAEGDKWWRPKTFVLCFWRPKTWYWAGSKHLRGPHEESVTDFWPHLSENFMPNTIWVYT